MIIKCTQENLHAGLSLLGHLPSRNIHLPILNNILLEATETGVQLTRTNLEIGIRTNIRAVVEKVGEFTVDARVFSEYISFLPKKTIVSAATTNELACFFLSKLFRTDCPFN
jgi:DNA polymerase III sliding clamp (beta) subunit (PCNA family)